MSTRFIAATIMSAALLLVVLLVALRGCESSPEPSGEPIEYPDQEETTVAPSEPTVVMQYSNETTELPPTGGPSLV